MLQVSPGVVVTAWHVLSDLSRRAEHDTVNIDALNDSSEPAPTRVVRVDPLHDLTVLRVNVPLPGSLAGWFATDWVPLNDSNDFRQKLSTVRTKSYHTLA